LQATKFATEQGDCMTLATSALLGLPELPVMPLVGKPLDWRSLGTAEAPIVVREISCCATAARLPKIRAGPPD
jgi:hypothetical protein